MNIHIRASGIVLTDAVREYVQRRLQFAFGWADAQVLCVVVRLSDENGPRGGEDKRCRLQITFAGAPSLVIDDTEADLYVAIDRAADRAGRSVARRLERQRADRQRLSPRMTAMSANTPTLH